MCRILHGHWHCTGTIGVEGLGVVCCQPKAKRYIEHHFAKYSQLLVFEWILLSCSKQVTLPGKLSYEPVRRDSESICSLCMMCVTPHRMSLSRTNGTSGHHAVALHFTK